MKLTTRQKVGICLTTLGVVWTINQAFLVLITFFALFPFIAVGSGLYLMKDIKLQQLDDQQTGDQDEQ